MKRPVFYNTKYMKVPTYSAFTQVALHMQHLHGKTDVYVYCCTRCYVISQKFFPFPIK